MTSEAEHEPARGPLSAGEYVFLACAILFWAAFVIVLGKDTSWDFRNYHWYGPYALFNHRLGIDARPRVVAERPDHCPYRIGRVVEHDAVECFGHGFVSLDRGRTWRD